MAPRSSLKAYRRKRNFKQTTEPQGSIKKNKNELSFVIQKHNASHLHYDFRLEMRGTLKSWAIPKGPSLDPSIKRLAVEVEDHPLEYASFEGVIPQGQYGGGVVMIWDYGTWNCDEDPYQAYRSGRINVTLKGKKLEGTWNLIKITSRANSKYANSKQNWLLIKAQDKFVDKQDILQEKPLSAVSQLSTAEIKEKSELNLDSKPHSFKSKPSSHTLKSNPQARSPIKSIDIHSYAKKSRLVPQAKLPKNISPELCTLLDNPPRWK